MADAARAAEQLAAGKVRLPPGRHGLPRAFVAENQRERLLNGVVEAVAEHGYNATTIGKISEASKISRRTFYEYFASKEECFLAAYAMVDEHVRGSMLAAAGPAEPWPEQVRAKLAALLEALSRDAAVARFYLVEPLAAGARSPPATATRCSCWRRRSGRVAALRDDVEVRDQVLMGGIATLISRRLKAGEATQLGELLPDLVELALAPYLGRDEARRVARSQP